MRRMNMAIPGYMWMTDSQGNPINSTVKVQGRENSAEIYEFHHEVSIPADNRSGVLTGTRKHGAFKVVKQFCSATPVLNKACASGQTLQQVKLSWYRIDATGKEQEYFRQTLSNAKVVAVKPTVSDVKDPNKEQYGHLEEVHFRYEKIQWLYLDGNIAAEDSWTERS
jgi:type VI secretion system secreted protein Hcp